MVAILVYSIVLVIAVCIYSLSHQRKAEKENAIRQQVDGAVNCITELIDWQKLDSGKKHIQCRLFISLLNDHFYQLLQACKQIKFCHCTNSEKTDLQKFLIQNSQLDPTIIKNTPNFCLEVLSDRILITRCGGSQCKNPPKKEIIFRV